jgi:hypothetical protein
MQENRVFKNMCLSEREEIRSGWIKLYNEEGHDSLFSTNVMRVNKPRLMRMTKFVVSIIWEKKGLVGKS